MHASRGGTQTCRSHRAFLHSCRVATRRAMPLFTAAWSMSLGASSRAHKTPGGRWPPWPIGRTVANNLKGWSCDRSEVETRAWVATNSVTPEARFAGIGLTAHDEWPQRGIREPRTHTPLQHLLPSNKCQHQGINLATPSDILPPPFAGYE